MTEPLPGQLVIKNTEVPMEMVEPVLQPRLTTHQKITLVISRVNSLYSFSRPGNDAYLKIPTPSAPGSDEVPPSLWELDGGDYDDFGMRLDPVDTPAQNHPKIIDTIDPEIVAGIICTIPRKFSAALSSEVKIAVVGAASTIDPKLDCYETLSGLVSDILESQPELISMLVTPDRVYLPTALINLPDREAIFKLHGQPLLRSYLEYYRAALCQLDHEVVTKLLINTSFPLTLADTLLLLPTHYMDIDVGRLPTGIHDALMIVGQTSMNKTAMLPAFKKYIGSYLKKFCKSKGATFTISSDLINCLLSNSQHRSSPADITPQSSSEIAVVTDEIVLLWDHHYLIATILYEMKITRVTGSLSSYPHYSPLVHLLTPDRRKYLASVGFQLPDKAANVIVKSNQLWFKKYGPVLM